jgi:hypothetical protein
MRRVKLFTHEVIVHSQLTALENILNRCIHYEISLNGKDIRSNIQFDANEKEINLIKAHLSYNVMVIDDIRCLTQQVH